tara:strand:- start:314 stop:535 length:222 start_codon:yes stop_codon:yes gene_type:complete
MTLQDKIHHTNEIADAIQREGQSVYIMPSKSESIDFEGKLIIKLPTPQVAGTMGQQRTYAMMKAMDIIENLSL